MRGSHFLDFDLMFQRTASGFRAQVLGSPAGQASIDFTLPFSDLEIENFLLRCGRPRRPVRRLGSMHIEAARAFGGRLFAAAFAGEVRSCLRSSLDEAHRLGAGLRIRLRLTDTPELNTLPWEFLLHPALDRFLGLSSETPVVRYLELPERIRPLAVRPPLEVLTVISSPTDCVQLDVEDEWLKLEESLAELRDRGLLRISRLESPTLSHLQRWLRRETCHILHFIGHGGFNPKNEDGALLFTDEYGHSREVPGQALGTLLHDHRPLRLAFLNACEGARTSRSDPFSGVAQNLVRQGIPAVVAMQFEISDKAAVLFAHELYAAVVDGYPIDAALAEARKGLYFEGHELEWGTPVLYMRAPDGQIFDIEPESGSEAITGEFTAPSLISSTEPALQQTDIGLPTGKALPIEERSSGSPTHGHPHLKQASGLSSPAQAKSLGWISIGIFLGFAAVVAILLLHRNDSQVRATSLRAPISPKPELASKVTAREPGVYLKADVHADEIAQDFMFETTGSGPYKNGPRQLQDVLKFCFQADLSKGHKITFKDIGLCKTAIAKRKGNG